MSTEATVTVEKPYQGQADMWARNLIDNNLATFGNTDNVPGATFRITMNRPTPITTAVIENRKDCCHDRIIGGMTVFVPSDYGGDDKKLVVFKFNTVKDKYTLDVANATRFVHNPL